MDIKIHQIAVKKIMGSPLSKEEQVQLEGWLKNNNNQQWYNELLESWVLTGKIKYTIEPDINKEWDTFKQLRDQKKSLKINPFVWAAAASIAIVFGLFVVLTSPSDKSYISGNNKMTIELDDGSVVTLNKNSTLMVDADYNRKNRNVALKGEAFFNVSKNDQHPFEITTKNNIVARVVGTSFNLRAYEACNNIELLVVTGIVAFGEKSESKKSVVQAGNKISYNVVDQKMTELDTFNENLLGWQSGVFEFNHVLVKEIVQPFERYFDKDIVLPPNSDNLYYTGKFNQPTEKSFAKVVSLALGWEYTISSNKIIFTKK